MQAAAAAAATKLAAALRAKGRPVVEQLWGDEAAHRQPRPQPQQGQQQRRSQLGAPGPAPQPEYGEAVGYLLALALRQWAERADPAQQPPGEGDWQVRGSRGGSSESGGRESGSRESSNSDQLNVVQQGTAADECSTCSGGAGAAAALPGAGGTCGVQAARGAGGAEAEQSAQMLMMQPTRGWLGGSLGRAHVRAVRQQIATGGSEPQCAPPAPTAQPPPHRQQAHASCSGCGHNAACCASSDARAGAGRPPCRACALQAANVLHAALRMDDGGAVAAAAAASPAAPLSAAALLACTLSCSYRTALASAAGHAAALPPPASMRAGDSGTGRGAPAVAPRHARARSRL